jgi:hypothetical protein
VVGWVLAILLGMAGLLPTVSANSKKRELLAVCVHFNSSGHPLGDSSDFIFFVWPLRKLWRLRGTLIVPSGAPSVGDPPVGDPPRAVPPADGEE